MTTDGHEPAGHLDDATEEETTSSTTQGAAAAGDYDPAQGSPGGEHPTGQDFPDEAVRYDQPDERPRADPPD